MNTTVFIENCSDDEAPDPDSIRRWVDAAIAERTTELELSIRIVSEAEGASLNKQYRGKSGPTNVLSFPADLPDYIDSPLLGDIVICASLVRKEACEQEKSEQAHWAHLVVHGTLHLLGYDHIEAEGTEQMEALETRILLSLSFPAPYKTDASINSHSNFKNDSEIQDL